MAEEMNNLSRMDKVSVGATVTIMISEDGPKVIEFNNRFGDPECQSVLARLDTDLCEIFEAVRDNRLADVDMYDQELL